MMYIVKNVVDKIVYESKDIIKWFKRNPCKECIYYRPTNGTCSSKKCAYANPYVTKIDRLLCDPCKTESEKV